MAFDGTEGGTITLAQGATMTEDYRTANPNGINGVFMGKDILNQILDQNGCMGIRVYFALDASGRQTIVCVGADSSESDQENDTVANLGAPCPPRCKTSQLNS
jgi:hypothetical protein